MFVLASGWVRVGIMVTVEFSVEVGVRFGVRFEIAVWVRVRLGSV